MPPPPRPSRASPPPRRGPRPSRPSRPLPPPAAAGPDGTPQVALSPRGTERWQSGHPWIYRADLALVPPLEGGEVVRVVDGRGWFMGKAFYSSRSKIALRWMSFEDVEIGPELLAGRIAQADALRRSLYPDETTYRVVHGEADLLPGLVVDRYGDVLSVQFLVQATEARKDLLTDLLVAHFKPRGVMDRSDVNVRTLEGLEPRRAVLRGDVPERLEYAEGLVRVSADVQTGQKTGAFLDQRENHQLAATYARGRGAGLLLLPRRVRPAARHPRDEGHRGGDLRAGVRGAPAHRPAQRVPERGGGDGQRLRLPPRRGRRGPPVRHHRARPALLREEQGRHRVRGPRATRRSTSGRCSCSPAAASS